MCHGFGEGDERQTSALNCLEDGEKEGYSGQGEKSDPVWKNHPLSSISRLSNYSAATEGEWVERGL